MIPSPSQMWFEALSSPERVRQQLAQDEPLYAAIAESLRREPPTALLTLARRSADHAAHYLSYLVLARLGRLVNALPISLMTLYQSRIEARGLLTFTYPPSAGDPDLNEPTRTFGRRGARSLTFVQELALARAQSAGLSPDTAFAEPQWVVPLHAGPERSLATTKGHIAQLVAGARLVATWQDAPDLKAALADLPDVLARAVKLDWSDALAPLVDARRIVVIGGGTGLPLAREAALKFQETCGIQAEAVSGTQVRHGPPTPIEPDQPFLVFAPRGPAQAGLLALAAELRERGARVLLAAPPGTAGVLLPLASTGHEDLDPIAAVQSFYPMVEALSFMRGCNPDRPLLPRRVQFSD